MIFPAFISRGAELFLEMRVAELIYLEIRTPIAQF